MPDTTLRPLRLGEILDRTFSLYRNHFLLFAGIMAVPALAAIANNLIVNLMQGGPLVLEPEAGAAADATTQAVTGLMSLVMGILYGFVFGIALGATTLAVSDVYLSRPTGIRQTYDRLRGRIWRIIGLLISIGLRVYGIMFLAVFGILLVGMGAIAAAGQTGSQNPFVALAMAVAIFGGLIIGLVLMVWLALRYSIALQALLLEGLNGRDAIKRSVALTKGHRGNAFLIFLLYWFIAMVAGIIFLVPVWGVTALVWGTSGGTPFWWSALAAVLNSLAVILTGPIMTIALVLYYYDLRVRKEAFDIQLMMQDLDGPVAPPVTAAPLP